MVRPRGGARTRATRPVDTLSALHGFRAGRALTAIGAAASTSRHTALARWWRRGPPSVFGAPAAAMPLKNFSLSVSLEEFVRYAYKTCETQTELDRLTDELRQRLEGQPTAFRVRFTLDPEALRRTLSRVAAGPVARVAISIGMSAAAREEMHAEAITHLLEHVLPALSPATRSWRSYLAQSARNFCRDRHRALSRRPEVPFGLGDLISDT